MIAIRAAKVALVAAIALFASLVAFGNMTDYDTNFVFVQHVLSMDTIYPSSTIKYRAIASPGLHHAAYAVIIYLTVLGRYTIGSLTFLAGSFRQSRDLIQRFLLSLSQIYENALYLSDLFVFFDLEPTIKSKPGARPVPSPIRDGFVFEGVSFRYGDKGPWAVRNLSFHLHPSESVALVGENGAGKTTLVKLLCNALAVVLYGKPVHAIHSSSGHVNLRRFRTPKAH
jgi:predicted small integral membrane protein